ncbi:hypothetical protein HAX54_020104 [Datura stramonium]|uniref:Uncharacterized protein n=1 Tax=Datura stramonium TaxID=4076 RepID=A0ABS8UR69_DATST|nr:hypothetical protein [Datura stramonium]
MDGSITGCEGYVSQNVSSELMAPLDNVAVSTDKLRQQLLKERLMLLKQKHRMLMDTLRQLETEKDKYGEASASESEDDTERVDAAEEDTDDEENTFFDTEFSFIKFF